MSAAVLKIHTHLADNHQLGARLHAPMKGRPMIKSERSVSIPAVRASLHAPDRRRAYRIRLAVLAYVRREDGHMERWDVENLSTTGMLCTAKKAVVGEEVLMAVDIPGRCFEVVGARAIEVRPEKSGTQRVALAFTSVPDAYEDSVQDAITDHLERHARATRKRVA
jgi:c-di-GMP-binding flagellar brake protein YcgR